MSTPMVSICMITYNHAPFLAQAIEGVLMQKCNFNIQLVIRDDVSTDRTDDICKEYAERNPQKINYHRNVKNLGVAKNILNTLQACTGKYIAICEGDDYWIDPYKLQKQVDFLEANEDYILCYTNAIVVDEHGVKTKEYAFEDQRNEIHSHLDMPHLLLVPTLTRLFRNIHINDMPASFMKAPGSDCYLLFWQSKFGKIKYHNYCSAAYRVTGQGAWSGKKSFDRACFLFKTSEAILDITGPELIEERTYRLFNSLAYIKNIARTDLERKKCKDLYRSLCSYFYDIGRLKRADSFTLLRWKVSLVAYYYFYNSLVQVGRKFGIKRPR